MRRFLGRTKQHVSYANIVATMALLFAMAGGATAASEQVVIAAKKIGGSQIKPNSITTSKVRNGSLLARDFAAGQIPAGAPGAAGTAKAWGHVTSAGIVRVGSNLIASKAPGTGRYCVGVASGAMTVPLIISEYNSTPDWGGVQARDEFVANPLNPQCQAGQFYVIRESNADGGFFVAVP